MKHKRPTLKDPMREYTDLVLDKMVTRVKSEDLVKQFPDQKIPTVSYQNAGQNGVWLHIRPKHYEELLEELTEYPIDPDVPVEEVRIDRRESEELNTYAFRMNYKRGIGQAIWRKNGTISDISAIAEEAHQKSQST